LGNHIAFDTATRHAAHDVPIFADGHLRTRTTRRGAPSGDNSRQDRVFAVNFPLFERFQNVEIFTHSIVPLADFQVDPVIGFGGWIWWVKWVGRAIEAR